MNLDESDELGAFIFRTKGFNSIRTLAARLSYYHAASNGLLSCLPLQLTLRGKSTIQSYCQPVYYVDLTLREGISLNDAIVQAKQIDEQSEAVGFYQEALDHVARQGFANVNTKFEMDIEEGVTIMDEVFQEDETSSRLRHAHDAQEIFDVQKELKRSA